MRYLRTVSTSRLLATIAGVVIAAVGGTAIAVAAAGSGPVPAAKPLAAAIHQALGGKAPTGISADISFTDNLIPSTDLEGSDPLLSGATGRLWMTNDHFRLELQSDNGDAQIVADRQSFWVYDPSSQTVYEGSWPAAKASERSDGDRTTAIPTIARIQTELNKLAAHLLVSGADPTDVAGQPAYRVTVSPKDGTGLLGSAAIAWDAIRGIPLDFAIYARGTSAPALELQVTGISYGPVALSDFAISPPSGAKVVKISSGVADNAGVRRRPRRIYTYTPPALSFTPSAPPTLAGLALRSTRRVEWDGSAAELLVYGKGLGRVAVIEHAAKAGQSFGSGRGGSTLSLPTIAVGGVTAQELPTELGTVVQFTRSGVSYLVAGSVPAGTAAAVARGL